MNKKLLFYLVGGLSVILAGTAAFFSIAGLAKLFAGAATAVIIMASALELSKLIIASFLYQYWQTMSTALKSYLLIATVIIMSITSIGIYGFLSAAYQETKNTYDLSATLTDSLNSKKSYYETYANTYQKQIEQQNVRLVQLNSIRNSQENRLNSQTGSSYQNTKSSRLTDKQIDDVTKDIYRLNKIVLQYTDSINKLTVAATQSKLKNNLTSDLGPLEFISNTFNVTMDRVVNLLIILFIIVFDPLAICLVLAYNFMKDKLETIETESKFEEPIYSDEDLEEMKEWEEASLTDYQDHIKSVTQRIEPEEVEEKFNEITASNTIVQPDVEIDQASLVEPVIEQQIEVKPPKKTQARKKTSRVVVESMDYMSPEPTVDDTILHLDEVRAQKAERAKQLYSGGISTN
jgi:hypothetical protein